MFHRVNIISKGAIECLFYFNAGQKVSLKSHVIAPCEDFPHQNVMTEICTVTQNED